MWTDTLAINSAKLQRKLHYSMSDSEIPRYQTRSSKTLAKESARDSPDSDSSLLALVSTMSSSSTVEAQQKGSATSQTAGQTSVLDQLLGQNEKLSALVERLLERDEARETERRFMERTHKEEEAEVAEKQQADRLYFEQKRLDLDQEMLQQSNLQYERDQKERKRLAVCQALKQWDDRTDTETYLENFEISMNEAEIPQNEWLPILRKQLTGKALTAFKEISPGKETPYRTVKDAMMERMGVTARQSRRSYWLRKPKADEGPEPFLEQALRTITRVSNLMTTPQEVQKELFKGLVYRFFSEEAILLVEKSKEKSLYRLTQDISQLWHSKDGYGRRRMMPNDAPYQQQLSQRRTNGGNYKDGGSYQDRGQLGGNKGSTVAPPPTSNKEGEPSNSKGGGGVRPSGRDWGGQRSSRPQNNQGYNDKGQIICFNCQKPGHIKAECPEPKLRLARLGSPGREGEQFVKEGSVNGIVCRVILDSGAMMTAVPSTFIAPSQYCNKQIEARMADMSVVQMELAKVIIKVEGVEREMEVIALTADAPEVLLGIDHPVTKSLNGGAPASNLGSLTVPVVSEEPLPPLISEAQSVEAGAAEPVETRAITRAQNQKLSKEREEDEAADARYGAMPKPVPITPTQPKTPQPLQSRRRSKFAPPTSQALTSTAAGNGKVAGSITVLPGECSSTTPLKEGGAGARMVTEKIHPTNTPIVEDAVWDEEEVVEDEVGEDLSSADREEAVRLSGIGGGGVEPCDLPLPVLCQGQEEVRELVAQQKEDEMLSGLRNCAERQENGYMVNVNGVLLHINFSDPGREFTRVVVPRSRRREVLDVAHKGLAGGALLP